MGSFLGCWSRVGLGCELKDIENDCDALYRDSNSLGIIYSSVQVLVFPSQSSYSLHVVSSPELDRAVTPARRNEPRIVRDICSQHSPVVTREALA